MLAKEMKTFVSTDDTSDPFPSDNDEEEAEHNEACIDEDMTD